MNCRRTVAVAALLSASLLIPATVWAKRTGPPKVEPIDHAGFRFSVPNDDGRRAYVVASDPATGKKAWEVTLFQTKINPALEEDVQWVFIRRLYLHQGQLLVSAENGKTYEIDPKSRTATLLKTPPK